MASLNRPRVVISSRYPLFHRRYVPCETHFNEWCLLISCFKSYLIYKCERMYFVCLYFFHAKTKQRIFVIFCNVAQATIYQGKNLIPRKNKIFNIQLFYPRLVARNIYEEFSSLSMAQRCADRLSK